MPCEDFWIAMNPLHFSHFIYGVQTVFRAVCTGFNSLYQVPLDQVKKKKKPTVTQDDHIKAGFSKKSLTVVCDFKCIFDSYVMHGSDKI